MRANKRTDERVAQYQFLFVPVHSAGANSAIEFMAYRVRLLIPSSKMEEIGENVFHAKITEDERNLNR